MKTPIYLDNNATTKPDPRVVAAMMPYLTDVYGNAASRSHSFGWQALEAVDCARTQVAECIGADPREIVFTSGATESDNLAIKGVVEQLAEHGNHVITASTEHSAVLDTAESLERRGTRVTYLAVDRCGRVDVDQVADAIRNDTVLVSIMLANNEIGTLQPVEQIGALCRERGVLFHTDATQAVGKIPVDVERLNVDLVSFTAHKMHGPKGIGALYVRGRHPRVRLRAQIQGGGHEFGRRSGTLNTPGIAGFGEAARIASREMADYGPKIEALRDRLWLGLSNTIGGIVLNGHPTERLCNNLNIAIPGVESDLILAGLGDIALSTGSACSSASPTPSHVLKAIGLSDELAFASLRFGLSRFTTEDEIDRAIEAVSSRVRSVRFGISLK